MTGRAAALVALASLATTHETNLLTEEEIAARDKSPPPDYGIRPVFADRPAERSRIPRTVRDTDRMSAAEAKRARKAAKALGIKPPDTLRDIMAVIDALKLTPPQTTIAVWSLGPDKQPVRLHTTSGKIYLLGRSLWAELQRECEPRHVSLEQGMLPSFAGVPIIDVDALDPLAKRNFAELFSTALGATP